MEGDKKATDFRERVRYSSSVVKRAALQKIFWQGVPGSSGKLTTILTQFNPKRSGTKPSR